MSMWASRCPQAYDALAPSAAGALSYSAGRNGQGMVKEGVSLNLSSLLSKQEYCARRAVHCEASNVVSRYARYRPRTM